ncbi:HPP family protein [Amycolatopsis sp. NPDC051903]|uniref:HPP family protein n=1 Tax=Amycolatopsis sp. NPDC051903 TaxID=3363936 RepID=UPI0037938DBA
MQTRDIMTTPVIAVTPPAALADAADVMSRSGFTTLPVVDPTGHLVGLVSEIDLVEAGFRSRAENTDPDDSADNATPHTLDTVAMVMHTPGLAVPADLDWAELARRMAEAGVRALPVMEHDKLIGMVTFRDVLRAMRVPEES